MDTCVAWHAACSCARLNPQAWCCRCIDKYDAAGNRVQPVGVELRHHRLGQVSDGQEVEVRGRWKDGTLQAERIVNLTTGAQVKGASRRARVLISAIILVIFVGWFVFLAFVAITQH